MIVVDANILIRAVLGKKVLALLRQYVGICEFVAPDLVFREARENLPHVLRRRSLSLDKGLSTLDSICSLISGIGGRVATWTSDRVEIYLAQATN